MGGRLVKTSEKDKSGQVVTRNLKSREQMLTLNLGKLSPQLLLLRAPNTTLVELLGDNVEGLDCGQTSDFVP